MWPISPALPWAPGSTRPSMPIAPAMPVPSGDEEEAVDAPARRRSGPRPDRPYARRARAPTGMPRRAVRVEQGAQRDVAASRGWRRTRRCRSPRRRCRARRPPPPSGSAPSCARARTRAVRRRSRGSAATTASGPSLAPVAPARLVQQSAPGPGPMRAAFMPVPPTSRAMTYSGSGGLRVTGSVSRARTATGLVHSRIRVPFREPFRAAVEGRAAEMCRDRHFPCIYRMKQAKDGNVVAKAI